MNSIDKFRKLKPSFSETDLMWLFYLSGEGEEREESDELLDVLMHRELNKDYSRKILLEPPSPELCRGSYFIGDVIYPDRPYCKFGLREDEWIKHVLITGMSGAGKTNLAFIILGQLRAHGKPFLVLDWKKSYRKLRKLPEFSGLKAFTVGRDEAPFRFNPLIPPPGCSPGEWLGRLIDVLKHAYFLGDGVEYLLREAIDRAYENNGVFDGSDSYPTFSTIFNYVRNKRVRGRMGLWQASAIRALASLTYDKGLGQAVDVGNRINPEELLSGDVILELSGGPHWSDSQAAALRLNRQIIITPPSCPLSIPGHAQGCLAGFRDIPRSGCGRPGWSVPSRSCRSRSSSQLPSSVPFRLGNH